MTEKNCPLCFPKGENVVAECGKFRIIAVEDETLPLYFRIIWKDHVKEMSDLSEEDGLLLWKAIHTVEKIMRDVARPEKINLAEFGTMVPHLHWHLIGRWSDDPYYPDSIWSQKRRELNEESYAERLKLRKECEEAIKKSFA